MYNVYEAARRIESKTGMSSNSLVACNLDNRCASLLTMYRTDPKMIVCVKGGERDMMIAEQNRVEQEAWLMLPLSVRLA